ncbi:TPA: hypothetical protein ACRNLW_001466 [Pseudomonas aeruginosa]|nr:hypothetical protein [Pseudomonas aeruginosa]ASD12129.1 hypothetical protein CD800_24895 [Pseudomonas aeruginosa]EIU6917336.1 hypothetical protein [Pseudomonas aeruginosa]EKI0103142.1 hypothetical protein [Pseudomonas aeruginosa]EKT8187543.1 hypothetical protein [Pseudomonas aeruginosa]EKW9850854.1 hypothetical protein [Pseudomonas aeruginosa]
MYSPRPYGRFAEDAELSADDAAAVERLARNLTNFKQASDLANLKRVADLPSGRQAVAIDMGGVFRILVLEQHELPQFRFDGVAQTNIPMLFSGVITRAQVLTDGQGVGIRLTEQTRRRLVAYDPKAALPPKDVALQRFVIKYEPRFQYFEPPQQGIYTFTQYVKQRPTWYSGAMAEVMQVAGGYGRQVMAELPEDDLERARMLIPERYMRQIRQQVGNVRLPAYTGFPDEQGQFKCEYRASRCNVVAFDTGNSPWLLQINARGVYAMPLPVVPATTTEAFREYVLEVGDDELLKLLDRFGGMPTGEGFPQAEQDFEAWRRAGVIIKVCDTADFYSFEAMYAACGWAVNSRGTEGFNTCWTYDSAGLMQVHAYKMKLSLAPAENQGRLLNTWDYDSYSDVREAQGKLNAYLAKVYEALAENGARELAIKYKIRRVPAADILARADSSSGPDVDYWDSLELPPIAAHQGRVSRVSSGPFYWPSKVLKSCTRLKFPELTGQGCESFPHISPDYSGGAVKCDTIVFGCYVEDQLRVIKYFYDERKFQQETTSTFEQYMIVGQWEKTETFGLSGLMGFFYTTDFDDRQEQPAVTVHTNIVGTDMGYGNPAYSTPPTLWCVGGVSRSRYYMHRTTVDTTETFTLDVAALVPVFERDCMLYAYQDHTGGRSSHEETTQGSVPDPTSYELWCYDDIWHWMGQTRNGNRGDPPSKDGVPVYVDTLVYSPTEISDFAESGNWLNLPPGGFLDVTGICGPYTYRNSVHNANGVIIGGEAPGFDPYRKDTQYPNESSGRLSVCLSVAGAVQVNKDMPHSWYWGFSPENDFYFYRDAVHVAIGDARYASIYETGQDGLRRRWGHTALADHKAAHHFIGVINE